MSRRAEVTLRVIGMLSAAFWLAFLAAGVRGMGQPAPEQSPDSVWLNHSGVVERYAPIDSAIVNRLRRRAK